MIRTTFVLATVLVAVAAVTHAQIDFSAFHTPAEVDSILDDLVAGHPGLAGLSTIGTSHEGHPIKVLKISDNVTTDEPDEDDVVFVALHHAREWISVEMALYLAEQLLVRYGTDPQVAGDVDGMEIWIIPVLNPDGYAYTHSVDRFWRKNRRDNGDGTFGVDLNRNWGFQWGLASGSSGSTADDTYRGPFAFSEPEVVALRDFVLGLDNLETMVSYHSYSELFLRPWGFTTDDAPGEEMLRQLALRSIGRIAAVDGHTYTETIWYTAAGEATDWFWGDHRISGFTPELRPASGSLGGFAPPPVEWFPQRPDRCVLRAEELLRGRGPDAAAEAVPLILRLEHRGLPHTGEALEHAVRQVRDLLRFESVPEAERPRLQALQNRLADALAVFRPGGLCTTLVGRTSLVQPERILALVHAPAKAEMMVEI